MCTMADTTLPLPRPLILQKNYPPLRENLPKTQLRLQAKRGGLAEDLYGDGRRV